MFYIVILRENYHDKAFSTNSLSVSPFLVSYRDAAHSERVIPNASGSRDFQKGHDGKKGGGISERA